MRRIFLTLALLYAVCGSMAARGFNDVLFMPRGQWSVGLQGVAGSLSSSDSDYMLVITGADASVRFARIAVEGAYAYKDNRELGLRFSYYNASANIDHLTADLMNEGMNFDVSGVTAAAKGCAATLYHRNYFGLDAAGVIGLFCDFSLGYRVSSSAPSAGAAATSSSHRFSLGFAPGVKVFMMDRVSLSLSIGLASLYADFSGSRGGDTGPGKSTRFGGKADLNLADLNFGLNFYF